MGAKDKSINAYIEKAQPFAKPILKHLRKLIHEGCPKIEETIKWNFPHFLYDGEILCSMASFKQHCAFGFWKAKLLKDPKNYLGENKTNGGEAMGNFGRISALADLPADKIILDFIKQAIKLNEEKVKLPSKPKKTHPPLIIPDYFMEILKRTKNAYSNFEVLSNSHKREYVNWITEAKADETRNRRIKKVLETIAKKKK